jgi:hypothetical protein
MARGNSMTTVAGYAGNGGSNPTHHIKDALLPMKLMIYPVTPRPCWVSRRLSLNKALSLFAGYAGYCIPFLYIYGELSLLIKICCGVENYTQHPAYPAAFGPGKGSFLSVDGEGNANREIPLEADTPAYATCDPCNAAQPRHWLLKGLITRRAYQVQGGAGLSFKFVPFVRWFGYSNQGKLPS